MSRARAALDIPGVTVAQVEALWYDRVRWPAFIDGLHSVESITGDYPGAGATVVWDSFPGGRGRVLERVVSHEPRGGQELLVEDEKIDGTQTVRFEPLDGGVRIALELDYALKDRRLLAAASDVFFIRRAQSDSLQRTLLRFSRELADELNPPI